MIIILAATSALVALPAPKRSPAAAPSPATAEARRYCIQGTPTGTRIARRDCRTRAEWMERGFDPLASRE